MIIPHDITSQFFSLALWSRFCTTRSLLPRWFHVSHLFSLYIPIVVIFSFHSYTLGSFLHSMYINALNFKHRRKIVEKRGRWIGSSYWDSLAIMLKRFDIFAYVNLGFSKLASLQHRTCVIFLLLFFSHLFLQIYTHLLHIYINLSLLPFRVDFHIFDVIFIYCTLVHFSLIFSLFYHTLFVISYISRTPRFSLRAPLSFRSFSLARRFACELMDVDHHSCNI